MSDDERPLTQDELARIPYFFANLEYSVKNQYYFGILAGSYFFGDTPEGPWTDDKNNVLDDADYLSFIPDSQYVSRIACHDSLLGSERGLGARGFLRKAAIPQQYVCQ